MKRSVFILFSLFLLLPFINADVISINSGGDTGMVVNPDSYIEGFFSCVPQTCSDLGYNCGTWTEICGLTLDCGTCSSGYTCTAGTCVAVPVTPPPEGGGGGGGVVTYNIDVAPTEIERYMGINTNIEESIGITNLDSKQLTFSVSSFGFAPDLIVNFWDDEHNEWTSSLSLTLAAGGIENLRIRFSAPGEEGTYNGTIAIDGKYVSVSLIVQEHVLLFDSNIVVLNENYQVPQGKDLRTQVTLIPLGDPSRLDVTLNYVIKDYYGKVYLTKSETLLIEETMNLKKNFDTGSLPVGKYIVSLNLVYPNGVAPSSAHFEVTSPVPMTLLAKLVLLLIILILIVSIVIIIVLIRRYRRRT